MHVVIQFQRKLHCICIQWRVGVGSWMWLMTWECAIYRLKIWLSTLRLRHNDCNIACGTFSVKLAICAGNSPVPNEVPTQRPVMRSFDVFFDLHLNKRLSNQSLGWWFETLWRPLWRQCNVIFLYKIVHFRPCVTEICVQFKISQHWLR